MTKMRAAGDTTKVVVSSGQQRRPALSRRAGPRRRASRRCRRGRRRGRRRSQQRRAGRRRAPRRRGRALRRRGRGRRRSLGLPREHRKHRRPHQRTQTRAEGWRGWRLQAGSSISHGNNVLWPRVCCLERGCWYQHQSGAAVGPHWPAQAALTRPGPGHRAQHPVSPQSQDRGGDEISRNTIHGEGIYAYTLSHLGLN